MSAIWFLKYFVSYYLRLISNQTGNFTSSKGNLGATSWRIRNLHWSLFNWLVACSWVSSLSISHILLILISLILMLHWSLLTASRLLVFKLTRNIASRFTSHFICWLNHSILLILFAAPGNSFFAIWNLSLRHVVHVLLISLILRRIHLVGVVLV